MFYDITNPEHKAELQDKLLRWRIEAESEHNRMHAEWNDADAYFENEQVPGGFSEAHRDSLANVNDPTQGSVTAKQYVVFNKILMTHEGVLGDFINGKKVLSVSGRSPKDKKFARVMKAEMEQVQDQLMLWDEIIVPTIDNGIRRGIHWIKIWFDPTQNLPFGKVMVKELSCRDILIDPKARGSFYQDKQYIIHRQRFLTEEANSRYGRLLDGGVFSPDRFSEFPYNYQPNVSRDLTTTIYEFQYRQLEIRYFFLNDQSGKVEEIDEATYTQLSQDPEADKKTFVKSEDKWYVALWSFGTGVFYNGPAEFESDTIIPFINVRSEGRLYPLGSTKYDKNLQDLLNVFISVLLDNAKRGNRGIFGVDTATYTQFADQIAAAINGVGNNIIPTDKYKVEYPREINPAVVQLFSMVEKALDDVQSQHALSKGEMPRERLAKETVNLLISQDRQSHGRKDIMIRWTLTKLAKLMFKIITTKYTESHWAKVTDTERGDPNYVPINQVLNETEYTGLLAEMLGIALEPDMPEEQMLKVNEAIQRFRVQFEKENEVHREIVQQFVIGNKKLSQEDYQAAVEQSGMSPEEFQQTYKPQEVPMNVYIINDINRDVDMDVVYEVDFNYERDREMKMNRAFALFDRQVIVGKRLLMDMDYPDADEAWEEAVQANQVTQLGQQILNDPQLYQAVMILMQRMAQEGAQPKNGAKKKEPAQ